VLRSSSENRSFNMGHVSWPTNAPHMSGGLIWVMLHMPRRFWGVTGLLRGHTRQEGRGGGRGGCRGAEREHT